MKSSQKVITFITYTIFTILSIWWVVLWLFVSPENPLRDYFSDTYAIIAGYGGIVGLFIAHKWGGLRSYVGKSIFLFSIGLLSQFLGQLSYTLEFYLYGLENSYPSFGEIFFLTTIPAYALGVWYIALASGSKISLKNMKSKINSVILPLIMMGISYTVFIRGVDIAEMPFIEKFLFIFYPLGQAVFVSFAALAYYLTGSVVGGVMRKRVFFILFSLIFQYVADGMFIFKSSQEVWYAADFSEFMFLVSYFLMSIALVEFLTVFHQLKKVGINK